MVRPRLPLTGTGDRQWLVEVARAAARVRYRVDGTLRHYMQVPLPVLARLPLPRPGPSLFSW